MLKIGQPIDRYTVEGKLGEGGMAEVYRLRHETLHTAHALKVLTLADAGVRERLVREGRMQAKLAHENIVSVTDVLTVGDQPGLLMEFVEGPTLEQWLARYRPTLDEIEIVFRAICTGVGVAHHRGLIHRDLKPANVLLAVIDDRIVPKVADFGLARQVDAEMSRHTRSGSTMGTPGYMAPEQIRDASTVDRRADLWSLGCILYRMACGVPAFDGDDLIELFTQVAAADYISSRTIRPELPDRIHVIIERTLQVSLAERIGDCAGLLDVLDGKRAEPDLQFSAKARMPSSERPRSIRSSPEAIGIAKTIVEETLSRLPKLARLHAPPLYECDVETAIRAESELFGTPGPLRPPVGVRAIGEPTEDRSELIPPSPSSPSHRSTGLWLLASAVLVTCIGALIVLVGSVGMWYLLAPPDPDSLATVISEPIPPIAPIQTTKPEKVAPLAERPAMPSQPTPKRAVPTPVKPVPAEPAQVTPAPNAPESQATGRLLYTGAEIVWLEGPEGAVRDLERVPPGRYKVLAVFGDTGVVVANVGVTIAAGRATSLTCVPAFAQCKEKE